jgi:hypothetical protein
MMETWNFSRRKSGSIDSVERFADFAFDFA